MLIATFNANSIRARTPVIKRWLANNGCDCLCVQETKVQDHDFPKDEFRELGLDVVFKGKKSYNGVAILSKKPLKDVSFGFGDGEDNEDDTTRLGTARLDKIWIMNCYAPQGKAVDHPDFERKLRWFERLEDFLKRRFTPSTPLIVTGDLNVAPEEKDVYAPERLGNHVCFHASVRERFKMLLNWGLIDLFRHFEPSPGHYTFYDYRVREAVKRGIGWRIDHILVTQPVLDRAIECKIDLGPRLWERPSDHTFLWARLKADFA